MARRYSTGLRNAIGSGKSWAEALADGLLYIFGATQPATADADVTGTLLMIFTKNGATYTPAVKADVELTFGGSPGTTDVLNSIKVGGLAENLLAEAITYGSHTPTTLATAVAASINGKINALGIVAAANTPSAGDVMLYAPIQLGATADGLTVAVVITQGNGTLTVDIDNAGSPSASESGVFAGGTTAINGLNFGHASSGVISKTSETWQAVALASGTAQSWRYVAGGSSYSGASTTDVRVDGNIQTTGGDANVANLTIEAGTTQTLSRFDIAIPAA